MHKRYDTHIIGAQYKLRLALSNYSDVSKVKHKEEKENKTKIITYLQTLIRNHTSFIVAYTVTHAWFL